MTTVERIVAEVPREPRRAALEASPLVAVRIGYREHAPRRRIEDAGGRWNPAARLGRVPGAKAKALDLERSVATGE